VIGHKEVPLRFIFLFISLFCVWGRLSMLRNAFLYSGFVVLAACGGSSSSSDNPPPAQVTPTLTPVTIDFAAVVGSEALACDVAYANVGAANTSTEIKDFRMFVHDFKLITGSGAEVAVTLDISDWQAQGVALLDFENASGECTGTVETNTKVVGSYEDFGQTFTGVKFTVGIPESINHLEQATVSPLNTTGMNWGWTGGYKFIRFDIPTWNVHLGATGCSANGAGDVSCTKSNRPVIELDNFDHATQVVQIDYAALVQDKDVTANTANTAVGCMSSADDPECPEIFTQLGLDLASGNMDPNLVQTVFSVAN
jgi:uncharacterized repeat protein (TIGR04052 family)